MGVQHQQGVTTWGGQWVSKSYGVWGIQRVSLSYWWSLCIELGVMNTVCHIGDRCVLNLELWTQFVILVITVYWTWSYEHSLSYWWSLCIELGVMNTVCHIGDRCVLNLELWSGCLVGDHCVLNLEYDQSVLLVITVLNLEAWSNMSYWWSLCIELGVVTLVWKNSLKKLGKQFSPSGNT